MTFPNRHFAEMLSGLCAEGVEFLLVGGYAVAAHGVHRATDDIDVWIRPSPENAARTIQALRRFGAPLLDLTEQDLATEGIVFQIGLPPLRIDIMTSLAAVSFEEAWPARVASRLGDVDLFVIGREHLIRNKRAAGRPKDLGDVAQLEAAVAPKPPQPKRPSPRRRKRH